MQRNFKAVAKMALIVAFSCCCRPWLLLFPRFRLEFSVAELQLQKLMLAFLVANITTTPYPITITEPHGQPTEIGGQRKHFCIFS